MRGELENSYTICKSLSFRKRIKSKSESIYHIFGILSSDSSNERFYYKAGEKYYWNLSRVHCICGAYDYPILNMLKKKVVRWK